MEQKKLPTLSNKLQKGTPLYNKIQMMGVEWAAQYNKMEDKVMQNFLTYFFELRNFE